MIGIGIYKILKAELTNSSRKPGEIISDNLEIACKELSIKVLMIQREGKRVQQINEFCSYNKLMF